MAEVKKMSVTEFKKYEEIMPVSNNVLVEVLDKEQSRLLESGILVNEDTVTNSKPYLIVRKVSKAVQGTVPIDEGDLVELGSAHISYFYGQQGERFALLNVGNIAGVYKKKG